MTSFENENPVSSAAAAPAPENESPNKPEEKAAEVHAAEAADRFKNSEDYYTYSRFTNPTVTMFQDRLAALEGGEACMATASGMSASHSPGRSRRPRTAG